MTCLSFCSCQIWRTMTLSIWLNHYVLVGFGKWSFDCDFLSLSNLKNDELSPCLSYIQSMSDLVEDNFCLHVCLDWLYWYDFVDLAHLAPFVILAWMNILNKMGSKSRQTLGQTVFLSSSYSPFAQFSITSFLCTSVGIPVNLISQFIKTPLGNFSFEIYTIMLVKTLH